MTNMWVSVLGVSSVPLRMATCTVTAVEVNIVKFPTESSTGHGKQDNELASLSLSLIHI